MEPRVTREFLSDREPIERGAYRLLEGGRGGWHRSPLRPDEDLAAVGRLRKHPRHSGRYEAGLRALDGV